MRKRWLFGLLGCLCSLQAQTRIVEAGPFGLDGFGLPAFFSRTEGWALKGTRALAKTTDGGATWKIVAVPILEGDTTKETRGDYFQSASEAWVVIAPTPIPLQGDVHRLFRTLDGGLTWTEQALPDSLWTGESLSSDLKSGSLWLGGQIPSHVQTWPTTVECPQRVLGALWLPRGYCSIHERQTRTGGLQ